MIFIFIKKYSTLIRTTITYTNGTHESQVRQKQTCHAQKIAFAFHSIDHLYEHKYHTNHHYVCMHTPLMQISLCTSAFFDRPKRANASLTPKSPKCFVRWVRVSFLINTPLSRQNCHNSALCMGESISHGRVP